MQLFNEPGETARHMQDNEGLFGGTQLVICGAPALYPIPPTMSLHIGHSFRLPQIPRKDERADTLMLSKITLTNGYRRQGGGNLAGRILAPLQYPSTV